MNIKSKQNQTISVKHDIIIIMCTIPNNNTNIASNISQELIIKKLAACVTSFPTYSTYLWNNKIEKQKEIQLLIKTHTKLKNDIFEYIKNIHPYQTPELIVLSVNQIDLQYFLWIKNALKI